MYSNCQIMVDEAQARDRSCCQALFAQDVLFSLSAFQIHMSVFMKFIVQCSCECAVCY